MKRDIWKYLVSSDLATDAWYYYNIMLIPFFPVQNKHPAARFICHNFDTQKTDIDNQKVQVADEMKRDT